MNEEEEHAAAQLPLEGAGQKLRHAREQKQLTIEQVAAETRIPMRHLEVIERGDFAALPARTYAIGFTRSYAKLVGLDEQQMAAEVRAELALANEERVERRMSFEPGDPAKVPSKGLVWFAAIAALLLIAGVVSFYGNYFAPGSGPESLLAQAEDAQAADADAASDSGLDTGLTSGGAGSAIAPGRVVFTALEDGIWVRFYDASGARLFEKQMDVGERYEVPADADGPQIWTGRPDALAITVGGQVVPKLAEDDIVIRDRAISAAALLARAQPAGGEASN